MEHLMPSERLMELTWTSKSMLHGIMANLTMVPSKLVTYLERDITRQLERTSLILKTRLKTL